MKSILLLGATGSIGQNTLDVIRRFPERFRIDAMAAGNNIELLAASAREFRPNVVAIANPENEKALRDALRGTGCDILAGSEAVVECVKLSGASMCVSAIAGTAGLLPTLAAIDCGMDIALANKETLVAAGELVTQKAQKKGARILPVDSEHSAIFQCMEHRDPDSVRQIILTASGGPFRGKSIQELNTVTAEDALAHPTWEMGRKITIDSATLANKALEVIEAHWLFGLPYDKIAVLVHPQSIVHGMVEFTDGSSLAQMSLPDMRIPIQNALSYPDRLESPCPAPDWQMLSTLRFEPPDTNAFPMFALGLRAGECGGTHPAVYSAANEEAVSLFLHGMIGFMEIPAAVEAALETIPLAPATDLETILQAERAARDFVKRRQTS